MSEKQVDGLPDPDLFRDAVTLATMGTFTPSELDSADALLVRLVWLIRTSKGRQR